MDLNSYLLLIKLLDKYGSGIFGKIAQKILALSFHKVGFTHIIERSVEGVDIDITENNEIKYAIEVKTTKENFIYLSQSNIDALKARTSDGYKPLIAVLKLAPLENWIISSLRLKNQKSGKIIIDQLRPDRLDQLDEIVNIAFNDSLIENYEGTYNKGLNFLIKKLNEIGIDIVNG